MKKLFLFMFISGFIFCTLMSLSTVVLARTVVPSGTKISTQSTFQDYDVTEDGAVFYVQQGGTLTVTSSTFTNNQTIGLGGTIYNEGTTEIKDGVTFSSNSTGGVGGAIYNGDHSTMTISGDSVMFSSNIAKRNGGAIFNYDKSIMTITTTDTIVFNSNRAGENGAIYNGNHSTMTISGDSVEFSSNTAELYGGAIFNSFSTMTTSGDNVKFSSNTANYGGAIYNICNSTMIINGGNVEFSSNIANYDGGAIYNYDNSAMTIRGNNVKFISNTAKLLYGGAINNSFSTMTINGNNIIFSSNTANYGGAIYNDNSSTMIITGKTKFEYNMATSSGGAIYNAEGRIDLTAKTGDIEFTGNKANGISNAIHAKGGTINLLVVENAGITFNDRITSEDDTSVLNINNSTGAISNYGKVVLNEDMSGYIGQVNLHNGTVELGQKGTWFGGNTMVDNATIDMANTILQEHNFKDLMVKKTLNLVVDADLKNKKMDTIMANSYAGAGEIYVKGINVLTNAKGTTEILFTSSPVLKDKITTINTAYSNICKYDVLYNQNTGYFNFINSGISPVVLETAVAGSVGGFITQSILMNQYG